MSKTQRHSPEEIIFTTVSMAENISPEKEISQKLFVMAGIGLFFTAILIYVQYGKPLTMTKGGKGLQQTMMITKILIGIFLIIQSISSLQKEWNLALEEFTLREYFKPLTIVHFVSAVLLFAMIFLNMLIYIIFTNVYNKEHKKQIIYKFRLFLFVVYSLSALVMLWMIAIEMVWKQRNKDIGITYAGVNAFGFFEWIGVSTGFIYMCSFRKEMQNCTINIEGDWLSNFLPKKILAKK
ncbi:fasting-inducible integral membrane protein tm6p1-related [Anaeramoeba flamelloides]|uniref:Fasting-inducible integral membrane protein tm6p1-related n=1 Tax=Anaeramoeba flamelloides TaxID=1746091 RepID=A0AAV7ZZW4_9EUKA|nr:fasting-inducible integral membrane protein tm6p1-related [Anaeramoeba flamelloides]